MKKILFIVLVFSQCYFAQTQEKGKIKFNFSGIGFSSGIEYDIPFTSISVRKESRYIINALAEQNNANNKTVLNIEFSLGKVWNESTKDRHMLDSLLENQLEFPLSICNNLELNAFNLNTRSYSFMMLNDNINKVGKYQNIERKSLGIGEFTYASQRLICKLSETSMKMKNNKFVIKGKFIIMLLNESPNTSSETSLISELNEGYFEIVL